MNRFVILLIFMVSCAPTSGAEPVKTPRPYYIPSIDASVGCPLISPVQEDVGFSEVDGTVTLTANVNRRPALFLNVLAGKELEYIPGTYVVSGEFRVPADAQNEGLSVNVQWVENSTEHFSEVFWTTNPESPLYEWVWTRTDLTENGRHKLFQLPHDDQWHTFRIVSDHVSHITRSITVDGNTFVLNYEMGTVGKAWDHSFVLLLETTNWFTGCNTDNTFVGQSQWRNVTVTRMQK